MKRQIHTSKNALRQIRHTRIRTHLSGSAAAPRLSVFRSLRGITAQLIDDVTKKTLCYVESRSIKSSKVEGKVGKVAEAYTVGTKLAELAKAKGITKVVFDRGGYRFHGRVAAIAEGARAGGLQF
jgi:large subunit ribosomal protein L18